MAETSQRQDGVGGTLYAANELFCVEGLLSTVCALILLFIVFAEVDTFPAFIPFVVVRDSLNSSLVATWSMLCTGPV